MTRLPLVTGSLAVALAGSASAADEVAAFSTPIRLQAGGADVRVESPGYACPSRVDLNGDGHADLVVGQFADGKMHVFHGDAQGGLTPAGCVMAGEEVAEVPGVW